MKTVQELLRHATPQITMQIYSQAVTQTKRAANAKVTTMIVRSNGNLAPNANGPLTDPKKLENHPHFVDEKVGVSA